MSEEFAKDVFGNSVEFAESNEIKRQGSLVDTVLLLIGAYMGWGDDISHVFVSDMSSIGDFCLDDSDLEDLSSKLGFTVSNDDYVFEVAKKLGKIP